MDVASLLMDKESNKFIQYTICTYAQPKKNQHKNLKDVFIQNLGISFHGMELLKDSELRMNFGTR